MRRRSPLTGRRVSRNERSATTLFSGTLICGYCGRELTLMRSAGKYKVMGCVKGPSVRHGCRLSTTKSTRIIEQCLLGFLRDHLLTEEAVAGLVVKANAYLAEEASKPRVDVTPLKAGVREKEAAIQKLFRRVEGCDDEALVQAYEKRNSELQAVRVGAEKRRAVEDRLRRGEPVAAAVGCSVSTVSRVRRQMGPG